MSQYLYFENKEIEYNETKAHLNFLFKVTSNISNNISPLLSPKTDPGK